MDEKVLSEEERDFLDLIDELQAVSRIPVHLFRNGQILLREENTNDMLEDSPFLHKSNLFRKLSEKRTDCAILADPYIERVYYGFLRNGPYTWILGPCALSPLEVRNRHEYMNCYQMTDYQNYQILYVSQQRMCAAVRLIMRFLNIKEQDVERFLAEEEETQAAPDKTHLKVNRMARTEEGFRHHSYRFEKEMLSLIKAGDPAQAEKLFSKSYQENAGKMSNDKKKQIEYSAVISVSMIARAAMDVGVDPYTAYDMNDIYLQKISENNDIRYYEKIISKAAKEFTEEVQFVLQNTRTKPHTERVKQYIRMNLNRELSMKDISDNAGLSPNYLSAIFHRQEGMTVSEFILQERVEASKSLLKYSKNSVSEIAAYLHFCTHSHFTAAFRKQTGMTPTQYRNKEQLIDR